MNGTEGPASEPWNGLRLRPNWPRSRKVGSGNEGVVSLRTEPGGSLGGATSEYWNLRRHLE